MKLTLVNKSTRTAEQQRHLIGKIPLKATKVAKRAIFLDDQQINRLCNWHTLSLN
jgi:hypothetical protein